MKATKTILGLTVAGALVAAGSMAAPAQAATPTKPVTKGFAVLTIDVEGLPAGSFVAQKPARSTPGGMVFPISSVVRGRPETVNLSGLLGLKGVSTGIAAPLRIDLNNTEKAATVNIVGAQGELVQFFYSAGMTVSVKTTANKVKKLRTTTTTSSGDLLVSATDPAVAEGLNSLFGVTVFTPGGKIGTLTVSVTVVAPCKNAACTR